LAHAIGDKVEAAYRRGDLFEKRRVMMEDWAAFLARVERPAEVVSLLTGSNPGQGSDARPVNRRAAPRHQPEK
jgi:hypothetical protein